ncbi:MAG: transglutaminase-like domain-containing protein [Limibacillus sp.]|jgi:regulator of sirC expression with transglutaminase-like and TPR domain
MTRERGESGRPGMGERPRSALAVPSRSELEQRLRDMGAGPDAGIDLAEGALLMAALHRPGRTLEPYERHLEELSANLAASARDLDAERSLEGRVEALRGLLAERHGYRGDHEDYDDPQNANLMAVMERRRGLPVALGILTLAIARAQGWAACGLAFPGHFLLRLDLGGARAVIDPFNGWQRLESAQLRDLLKAVAGLDAELTPAHYAPVENRKVLLRLQNNIKLRALQAERFEEALSCLEIMLMLAPGEGDLWRELGLVHAELGNLRAGILSLEQFLEIAPGDRQADEVSQLLRILRSKLN